MENIHELRYAAFMENVLQRMIPLPVEGVCILVKMKDGSVFSSYHNSTMMDKILYAGIVQQDVTLDMLKTNSHITEKVDGEET